MPKQERYRVLLMCKKCDKVYNGSPFVGYEKAISIYHSTLVNTDETCKNKDCDSYIKLNDRITVLIEGKPIGKFINMATPTTKFDRMLKAGKISEDEYNLKIEQYADGGKLNWIKRDLTFTTEG